MNKDYISTGFRYALRECGDCFNILGKDFVLLVSRFEDPLYDHVSDVPVVIVDFLTDYKYQLACTKKPTMKHCKMMEAFREFQEVYNDPE